MKVRRVVLERGFAQFVVAALTVTLAWTPAGAAQASSSPSPSAPEPGFELEARALDPGALPRGNDARVDRLSDGVISTGKGARIPTRVRPGSGMGFLGRSGRDWLVSDAAGQWVYRIRSGRPAVRVRYPRTDPDRGGRWLSRDGRLMFSVHSERDGLYYDVTSVPGRRALARGGSLTATAIGALDADRGRVIIQLGKRAVEWRRGAPPRPLAPRAVAAFAAHDVIFVRDGTADGGAPAYGPTALSAPGVTEWTAPFVPLDVSPDGRLLVGVRVAARGTSEQGVLELRSMADGSVLQAFEFGAVGEHAGGSVATETTARFENRLKYVFELTDTRGRSTLVRCTPSGFCERAAAWSGSVAFASEWVGARPPTDLGTP